MPLTDQPEHSNSGCLRFKCSSVRESKPINRLPVHELSAVNGHCLRFKCRATPVLLEQGLVNEVLLLVYPVLLGRGKRFFSESADPRGLAFVSTKAMSSGVIMNIYAHVRLMPTKS